jgi:hypothetical protein
LIVLFGRILVGLWFVVLRLLFVLVAVLGVLFGRLFLFFLLPFAPSVMTTGSITAGRLRFVRSVARGALRLRVTARPVPARRVVAVVAGSICVS